MSNPPRPFTPEATAEEFHPAIARFLELAKIGRSPQSSTGERAAYRLSLLVKNVSLEMQDMDSNLQNGFLHLLRYAAWPDTRHHTLDLLPKPRR